MTTMPYMFISEFFLTVLVASFIIIGEPVIAVLMHKNPIRHYLKMLIKIVQLSPKRSLYTTGWTLIGGSLICWPINIAVLVIMGENLDLMLHLTMSSSHFLAYVSAMLLVVTLHGKIWREDDLPKTRCKAYYEVHKEFDMRTT